MSTAHRTEINRANSQHSTGPRPYGRFVPRRCSALLPEIRVGSRRHPHPTQVQPRSTLLFARSPDRGSPGSHSSSRPSPRSRGRSRRCQAFWKTGNPEQDLATHNCAGDDTVALIQPGHPSLNSLIRPHQVADDVRIEQEGHYSRLPVEHAVVAHR